MIWKDVIIDGYWTDYEVSDQGTIRVKSTKDELPIHLSDQGYGLVYLRKAYMDEHITRTTYRIHRLIMIAFEPIDNADEMTVDHIDKNKMNNKLENLRWLTREDNSRESHKFGRVYPRGANANRLVYEESQIMAVCQLLEENELSIPKISELTKVSKDTIGKIKAGKQWTDISCEYNIPSTKPNKDVKTYTEEEKQRVLEILINNPHIKTKDLITESGLPCTNATRMFINRIRHKFTAEYYK